MSVTFLFLIRVIFLFVGLYVSGCFSYSFFSGLYVLHNENSTNCGYFKISYVEQIDQIDDDLLL